METDQSTFAQEVLDAHNKLRTNPKYFIPALEEMVSWFTGNRLARPGRITLVTNEGAKAVKYEILNVFVYIKMDIIVISI